MKINSRIRQSIQRSAEIGEKLIRENLREKACTHGSLWYHPLVGVDVADARNGAPRSAAEPARAEKGSWTAMAEAYAYSDSKFSSIKTDFF